MLELKQIHVAFGTKTVLNQVDANFEPGKVYGIVGENGAGKTTLFRCIAGLENFQGEVLSEIKPLKNVLGFLPADPYFLPKITGEEHVHLMTRARGKRIANLAQHNLFDLPLQQYVSTYSTGMKKKLALFATLLQDNACYILDEPYNGIDLQSSIILREIIKQLKVKGKTILISSHIFATLKETCDEIYLIDKGQFAAPVFQEQFDKLEDQMRDKVLKNMKWEL